MKNHSSKVVNLVISNISKESFDYILKDLTTFITNTHYNKDFSIDEIYQKVYFEDNNITNLDVNNIRLIL